MPNVFKIVLASFVFLATGGVLAADTMPQGSVVVTKARGDALAIWDATPVLAGLVSRKASRGEVMRELESGAATIVVSKLPAYKKTARTLTLLVLYAKTGAISPTYNVATFEGVERLLTLKASTQVHFASDPAAEFRSGKTPSGLELHVVGDLPPEIQ